MEYQVICAELWEGKQEENRNINAAGMDDYRWMQKLKEQAQRFECHMWMHEPAQAQTS